MGATLEDTLAEYAELARQQSTLSPPAGASGNPQQRPPLPVSPQGAAAGGPGTAPPTPPPEKAPGIIQKAMNFIMNTNASANEAEADAGRGGGKVIEGGAAGVLRAPGQLYGGYLDTSADATKFVSDNIHNAFVRKLIQGTSPSYQAKYGANGGASLADTLSFRQTLGQVGDHPANEFMAQGVASTLPLLLPGIGEAGLATRAATVGLGSAVSADAPAATPGARLVQKGVQGAAGAALELTAGTLGIGAKYLAAKYAGRVIGQATPAEVAADAIERDFSTVRTNEAKYAAADPEAAKEEAASGQGTSGDQGESPPAKAGGKEQAPADPLATDANTALEASGSAERLPTDANPTLTKSGSILVSPESKATLDAAGLGRAFAASEPADGADVIHLKETSPDGGSRVVGVTTQRDLDGFIADAKRYAAEPDTINTDADHPSGQWNLRPMGSSDNVSAIGRAYADRLPGDARPITNEETLAAAKEMGFDHPADAKLLASLLSDQTSGLSKGLTAGRLLQAKLNEEMLNLGATDWSKVPVFDTQWHDALKAYHNGYSFMQALRQAKSEVARTLQAMQMPLVARRAIEFSEGLKPEDAIPPQEVPDFDTFKNNFGKTPEDGLQPYPGGSKPPLPRTPQEFQDMLDLHRIANEMGPDALHAFWKGASFAPNAFKYLRTSFANFYTAGLISRTTTFMRDLLGPAVMGGLRTMERTAGGILGGIYNAAIGKGDVASDLFTSAAQAPLAYARTFGDILSSLKAAASTARHGISGLHGMNPYDFNAQGVPPALIDAASGNGVEKGAFIAGNIINTLPRAIHALHGGVNELALRLSYLGEIRAGAMLEANRQGLTGDAASDYVKQAVMAAEDPISGMATDVSALESAQRTTFTKPIADRATQPVMASVTSAIQNLRENVPETRYILPILSVPANAVGETLRRIPVLGQLFKGTQAELSGAMGTTAQAEAYGRMLSGAGIMTIGALMSRAGNLTGAGPSNAHDREVWLENGFQPYSIKVGGKWISYAKFDGVGPLLGIMAGHYDSTIYHPQDNPRLAYAAVSGLAEYFKEQSSLMDLSNLLSFGGNPAEDNTAINRFFEGVSSGFVPGFIQQARQMDPQRRVVRNPWEAILNALPTQSEKLDPVRNLMGDAVHVPHYLGQVGPLAPTPLTTSDVNPQGPHSEALKELDRLMLVNGYAPGVLPTGVPGGKFDQRDVKLEDGHSLYDARMRYRALVTDDDGHNISEALQALVSSDEYKAGFDGTPGGEATDDATGGQNRGRMIAGLFRDFDTRAKEKVAQDSPIAARWLAVAKAKQHNAPGLSAHPSAELVGNSSLLNALVPNIGELEDSVKGNP